MDGFPVVGVVVVAGVVVAVVTEDGVLLHAATARANTNAAAICIIHCLLDLGKLPSPCVLVYRCSGSASFHLLLEYRADFKDYLRFC